MKVSDLEQSFLWFWKFKSGVAKEYNLVAEHTFLPDRKFRFDFAVVDLKVAIEIEGGLYSKGGHNSVIGYNKDCEKYNLATLNEWRVLRFTEKMLSKDPMACIAQVVSLLRQRSAEYAEPVDV